MGGVLPFSMLVSDILEVPISSSGGWLAVQQFFRMEREKALGASSGVVNASFTRLCAPVKRVVERSANERICRFGQVEIFCVEITGNLAREMKRER